MIQWKMYLHYESRYKYLIGNKLAFEPLPFKQQLHIKNKERPQA